MTSCACCAPAPTAGPHIQQDQHALRRLHELEQRAGIHQVARPAKPEIVAPEALPKAVGPTPPASDVAVITEPEPVVLERVADPNSALVPVPPRGSLSRRLRVLWALSVVVAAALAGSAAYGIARISPVPVSKGAPQIATLEPSCEVSRQRPAVRAGW